MNVLIFFATVEGQTGKIARFAEREARRAGHDAVLADAADTATSAPFEGVDKVILAAPVHERRHPKAFEAFLASHRQELEKCATLLLSVSLNAAFPEGHEEAQEYLTEMKMRTGFAPDAEALVAGAVRTSHYDYFASQVVRHVLLRDRGYDPNSGEHEFTDWDALATTISEFLGAKARSG